jgi:hypothetical protein
MKPERVSRHHSAHEQLLYFTSSSLVGDDSELVFISDRTGHPNLFARELVSGREVQLTRNEAGYLKSYVYFDGAPYRGFGKASVSLHSASGTVYYIQGRDIRKVEIGGREHTLAQYPDGQMTAFTHVSADGRRLCVPTVDARALDGVLRPDGRPEHSIDDRVQAEGLSSYLRVYDTDTGEDLMTERVEKCWITHVQFSPVNPELILYNHEWPSDCGVRRMWLFDGKRHLCLRQEGMGRSRKDWVCHEMWERDGSGIIYHGRLEEGPSYVGRMAPDGTNIVEMALPTGSNRYGHFTVGSSGVLITDGYYEEPGDSAHFGGDWISRVDLNWVAKSIRWTPLCRSRSSWKSQDEHPHPILDHAMRYAYFTSDVDGKRAIYRIRMVKPVEQPPA